MEILFTPWRYAYLTSPRSEEPQGCIFCNAVAGDDRQSHVLFRGTDALVIAYQDTRC